MLRAQTQRILFVKVHLKKVQLTPFLAFSFLVSPYLWLRNELNDLRLVTVFNIKRQQIIVDGLVTVSQLLNAKLQITNRLVCL